MDYSVLQYNLGGYEMFREPACDIPRNCEYVYVTDDKSLKSSKMKIVYFRRTGKSLLEDCSYIKYNLFNFVNTDICFYIDACKQMIKPIDPIIERFDSSGCDLALNIHEIRHSFIDEFKAWLYCKRADKKLINKELMFMKSLGYDFSFKCLFQATSRIERKNDITREINSLTHASKRLLSSEECFERIDQVVYSFIVNHYFADRISVIPYSSRLYNSKYFANYVHGTNNLHNMGSDANNPYFDKGYVFNELKELEQFQKL